MRSSTKTLDRTLKDIMDSPLLFGGKVILFGGEFCQVLLVVLRGSRVEIISTSLVSSYLWPKMENLRFSINMRTRSDILFSDFLLCIGNGEEPTTNEDMIKIPNEILF